MKIDSLECDRSKTILELPLQMHLHGDVESWHIEGLEHDLGGVLSVLWCVEWRLGECDVMLLWLASKVVEETSLPQTLHVVPVLNQSVANGVSELWVMMVVST